MKIVVRRSYGITPYCCQFERWHVARRETLTQVLQSSRASTRRIYAPGACGTSRAASKQFTLRRFRQGRAMGAKVTCILDKRRLLRNQVTFARKRDTSRRAPSELFQSVFFTFPLLFSSNLPSQERTRSSEPLRRTIVKRSFSFLFAYTA